MFKHYLGVVKGKTCQGNRFGVLDWCQIQGVDVEIKPEVEGEYMMVIVAPKDCNIKSFASETFDGLMEKAKCISNHL